MAKKPQIQAPATQESTLELAASISAMTLAALRDHIAGVLAKKIKPPKQYTPIEHAAYLAKQASAVAAEARKAEKAELDGIRKLTEGAVKLWMRTQSPETRARLVREYIAMDDQSRKSVLG